MFIHMDLNNRIHATGHFFPWHRWYIHAIENDLKTKCGYQGAAPYWDWTKDASDFHNSPIFQDHDPLSGLGGWGSPSHDFALSDGSALSEFHLSYPSPHTLRRNFTAQPYLPQSPIFVADTFRKEDVEGAVGGHRGNFSAFQNEVEARFKIGIHSSVHAIMGGDLAGFCPSDAPPGCINGPTFSPNEPMFQLHHAMIDKIWSDWQRKHPKNKWAFLGGSVPADFFNLTERALYPSGKPPMLDLKTPIPADGLFNEVTIGDVMDTKGGYLCYVYV